MSVGDSRRGQFVVAACVPRDAHGSGTLEEAEAIREADPWVAVDDVYAAAVLGDSAVWRERTETVRLLLARGALVSASELSLAERALTELSERTPHHSREILDALRHEASDPR